MTLTTGNLPVCFEAVADKYRHTDPVHGPLTLEASEFEDRYLMAIAEEEARSKRFRQMANRLLGFFGVKKPEAEQ